jgi:hypothetical protein
VKKYSGVAPRLPDTRSCLEKGIIAVNILLLYAVIPADTHAVTMLLFEKIKHTIHNKIDNMALPSSLLRCFISMEPLFSGPRAAPALDHPVKRNIHGNISSGLLPRPAATCLERGWQACASAGHFARRPYPRRPTNSPLSAFVPRWLLCHFLPELTRV